MRMTLDDSDNVNMASSWCEICSDVDGRDDSVESRIASTTGNTPATMYCEDCHQRLCRRCGRGHKRLRFATDHRVVELSRVSRLSDDTRRSDDSSPGTCTTHKARPLELYCRDCREMGCVLCVSLDAHQDHRWCDVDAASHEIRRGLSRHLEQVGAKLEECRHAESTHRRSADDLEESLRGASCQLRGEVEKLHQDVDRCADELRCKLKAAEDKKTKTENRCVELQEQASRLTSFVEQCQRMIDSASAIEMMRSSSKLRTEAMRLVDEQIESDLCPNLRLIFTPTNLRQYLPQVDVNLVGTVCVDDAEVQGGDEDENLRFCGTVAQNQQKDFGSYADPNRQEAVSRQVHALESVLSKMLPRNLVMSVKWPTKSKETAVKRQLPELQLEPEISWSGCWSGWATRSSRSFSREVVGIATLAGDLYVMLKAETYVHVMDSLTFHTRRSLVVPELRSTTRDLAAGVGTLYIVDDDDNLHEHHVQSGSWTKWVVHNRAWSLSTSHAGDVLVTSRTSRLLLEYAPGGCLRLTVRLPADVVNPNHAVRVTSDQLAICHGDMTDETQRICIVSNCGEVLKSCKVGGTPWPSHLTVVDSRQVFVAFKNTEQVLSFDLHTMTMTGQVVASRNHGLRSPNRLHFNDNLLYVAGDKIIISFISH